MSRKKKKNKAGKVEAPVEAAEETVEQSAADEQPAETSGRKSRKAKKAKAEEADDAIIEMAEVEGLNLEFADDEDSADAEMLADDDETTTDESTEDETSDDDLSASAPDGEEEPVEGEISASGNEDEELEAAASDEEEEEPSGDDLADTELGAFESAEIEDVEHLTVEQIRSVVESILFATDKPLSIAVIKQAFKGTQVKSKDIREALTALSEEYGGIQRGFTLQEAGGGFQLRTKAENMKYLRASVKARPFKLSGPALEVMSIVAYKQPVTKAQIDEIRGVESGHLLRALMEKHLVTFGERSDLPGKPMFYETTRKFLEIFGLRNLQELPSLSEIDQLIPEGIGEVEDKETLSDLTGQLSNEIGKTYSEAEDELLKITDELTQISTSSEFFEKEKERMREKRDLERAQNIREALAIGEQVEDKDQRWLERYDKGLAEKEAASAEVEFVTEGTGELSESTGELTEPIENTDELEKTLEVSGDSETSEEAGEHSEAGYHEEAHEEHEPEAEA
jgi:segregation and condensation protein B